MLPDTLLYPTKKGLYCAVGDFYIDPVRRVERALITHGHSDHARKGNENVYATKATLDIMGVRYGENFCKKAYAVKYSEELNFNGVTVSFHPAGHILGSAQIKVHFQGIKIVASGDYKRAYDPTCTPFEVVPCDVFITEATFGLPPFCHPPVAGEIEKLLNSLKHFPDRAHCVGVYALGKAQRLICLLREADYEEPIYVHESLVKLNALYEAHGIRLGRLLPITQEKANDHNYAGKIVLAPPSTFQDKWVERLQNPLMIFASGWMQIRHRAKHRNVELPLILSDHADWPALQHTILEINPKEVWVTHGAEEALVYWSMLNKIKARPLKMVGYNDEAE